MQRDLLFHPSASLAAAIDEYLLACRIGLRSPQTIRFYAQALAHFARFAGSSGPEAIDVRFFRRFLLYLDDEAGLAPRSQHNYVVAVKTFVAWLGGEGEYGVDASFLTRVKAPRVEVRQSDPFTEEEVAALFAATRRYRDTYGWQGQRLRAIMAVLVDAGLRASTLCGLRVRDVDLATGALHLRAETVKTRKEQRTVLGLRAKREVARYWQAKRHLQDPRPESAFFMGWNDAGMSYDTLYGLLQRHGERAGVRGVHPHRFRHTFTRLCIRAKMDLFTVQSLLGHSDLTMTRRYYQEVETDVQEEKRLKSPLDRIKGRW